MMQSSPSHDPALADIKFAISIDEGDIPIFLDYWMHGDFDKIRREWPDCPNSVFVGAEIDTPRPMATWAP